MFPYENAEQDEQKVKKEKKRRRRNRVKSPFPTTSPKNEPFKGEFPSLVENPLERSRRRHAGKAPLKRVSSCSPTRDQQMDQNEAQHVANDGGNAQQNLLTSHSGDVPNDRNTQRGSLHFGESTSSHLNNFDHLLRNPQRESRFDQQNGDVILNNRNPQSYGLQHREPIQTHSNDHSDRLASRQEHYLHDRLPKTSNEDQLTSRRPANEEHQQTERETREARAMKKRRRRVFDPDEVIPSFMSSFQGGGESPLHRVRPKNKPAIAKRHSIDAMFTDRRVLPVGQEDRSTIDYRSPLSSSLGQHHNHHNADHGLLGHSHNHVHDDRHALASLSTCGERFGLRSPHEPSAARAFDLPPAAEEFLSRISARRPSKLPPIPKNRPNHM